jgi:hypothetical protein
VRLQKLDSGDRLAEVVLVPPSADEEEAVVDPDLEEATVLGEVKRWAVKRLPLTPAWSSPSLGIARRTPTKRPNEAWLTGGLGHAGSVGPIRAARGRPLQTAPSRRAPATTGASGPRRRVGGARAAAPGRSPGTGAALACACSGQSGDSPR